MATDAAELFGRLADRLERRADAIGGNSDLDDSALDRAEIVHIVAAEVRALAQEVEREKLDMQADPEGTPGAVRSAP